MVELIKKSDLVRGQFPTDRRKGKHRHWRGGDHRGGSDAITRLSGEAIHTEAAVRSGVELHPLENNPEVALDRGRSHPAGQMVHEQRGNHRQAERATQRAIDLLASNRHQRAIDADLRAQLHEQLTSLSQDKAHDRGGKRGKCRS